MTVMSQSREQPAASDEAVSRGSIGAAEEVNPSESRPDGRPIDLAQLVRERQAEVWRYLRFLGAAAAEADDLTQETFLAFARSSFVEQSEAQTAGYLRTVARRQLLMLRRTQRRRIKTVEFEAAETVWTEALWDDRASSDRFDDRVDAAKECVDQLEGRAGEAIDLAYRQRESREAIATKLGMKPDGVKTLMRRTRQVLRDCIEKRLSEVL